MKIGTRMSEECGVTIAVPCERIDRLVEFPAEAVDPHPAPASGIE